jgi:hypothetical protein
LWVRASTAVVDKLDLRGRYADVRARGENAGRSPSTDRHPAGALAADPAYTHFIPMV